MEHPPVPDSIKGQGQEAFAVWASSEKDALIEASYRKIEPAILAILEKYGCETPTKSNDASYVSFWGTDAAAQEIKALEGVHAVTPAYRK